MGNLKISRMILGAASTNCYIIYLEGSDEAIVIDPADLGEKIYNDMAKENLKCVGILLTHGHYDHMKGAKRLQQLSGAKIYTYETEKALCEDPKGNAGFLFGASYTLTPDAYLKDQEVFDMAGFHIKVVHTPGHTGGSCSFYLEEYKLLFVGDLIFKQSIGRSDLATGDERVLLQTLKERIVTLPEDTILCPGHGECTTVGDEKKYNPFCQF